MAPDGYAIAPTPLDPIRGLCYVDARRILATPTLPPRGSAMIPSAARVSPFTLTERVQKLSLIHI